VARQGPAQQLKASMEIHARPFCGQKKHSTELFQKTILFQPRRERRASKIAGPGFPIKA
jgi:hypothetical protein